MPAEVHIQTTERTAFSYLIKPLRDQVARTFREQGKPSIPADLRKRAQHRSRVASPPRHAQTWSSFTGVVVWGRALWLDQPRYTDACSAYSLLGYDFER